MRTDPRLDVLPIDHWLGPFQKPLVISGPCSAESEEQVIRTALELATIKEVRIFRAGIWKPRTRPDLFEGVGNKGLLWLKKVKEMTGLMTAVEVATAGHIEESLKAGIDAVWIGARTVMNPFSLQEISEVLKGVDIPVMIKNPMTPDLNTWIGALERINHAGISKLMAVHRGFFGFEKANFRNHPMWEIPIELKRLFPGLPVLCDPSHICGNRELIRDVSQKALDLEMDGLMIETHSAPESALTDASQQIKPADLKKILDDLKIRRSQGEKLQDFRLDNLRAEIDKLDTELLVNLARRIEVVKDIGVFKKEYNITILQLERWQKIIQDWLNKGTQLGLREEFLIRLLNTIHEEMIEVQNNLLNNDKEKR